MLILVIFALFIGMKNTCSVFFEHKHSSSVMSCDPFTIGADNFIQSVFIIRYQMILFRPVFLAKKQDSPRFKKALLLKKIERVRKNL